MKRAFTVGDVKTYTEKTYRYDHPDGGSPTEIEVERIRLLNLKDPLWIVSFYYVSHARKSNIQEIIVQQYKSPSGEWKLIAVKEIELPEGLTLAEEKEFIKNQKNADRYGPLLRQ